MTDKILDLDSYRPEKDIVMSEEMIEKNAIWARQLTDSLKKLETILDECKQRANSIVLEFLDDTSLMAGILIDTEKPLVEDYLDRVNAMADLIAETSRDTY